MNVLGLMERTDMSMGGWEFVLVCAGVMVVVAGMVFLPVRMARRRRELILVGAILWGMLMGGSVIFSYMAKLRWEKERAVQMASGYFVPGSGGKWEWPWGVWGGLMAGYGGLVISSARRARR